jgi:iron complex outermembrane receptor protein
MKTQGTPKQSAGQPKNAWPVLPLCLGIMTAISSPAYAENTPSHSSETHAFNIPAQSLHSALAVFAEQSGIQFVYNAEWVKGINSTGIEQNLATDQALQKLLQGTGLTFKYSGNNTIVLEVVPQSNANVLGAVKVTGKAEHDPNDPYNMDYNRTNASTATKTDTPIMETPISIQVVPRAVIQDQQGVQVGDAIKNVSGVFQGTTFGGFAEQFMIRGFNTQYANYYDGFRFPASRLSLANAERIEVVKGAAANLYGRIEPGGMINIVTKRPQATPYYSLEQRFGSYDLYQTLADATGAINKDGSLMYRVNLEYLDKNSFRDYAFTNRAFIAPSITWKISDKTQIDLDFMHSNEDTSEDWGIPSNSVTRRPVNIPISRFLGEPTIDKSNTKLYKTGATLTHSFSDNWKVKAKFNYLKRDVDDPQIFPIPFPFALDLQSGEQLRNYYRAVENLDSYFGTVDLTGKFSTLGVKHNVLFGWDNYNLQSKRDVWAIYGNGGNAINIYNPQYNPINTSQLQPSEFYTTGVHWNGVYFQDQITLFDKLHILGGGRYDWAISDSGFSDQSIAMAANNNVGLQNERFNPRVGILYQPWSWLSLFGNYVESLGAANTALGVDGKILQPEIAEQYEIGFKTQFFDDRLSSNVSFYNLTKQNLAIPIAGSAFSESIGKARSQGVEIDVTGKVTDGLSLIGTYAYTDAIVTKGNNVGNRLWNVPRNAGSLWAKYDFQQEPIRGLTVGAGVYFQDQKEGDIANSYELPGYGRVDALLKYRLPINKAKTTLQFNVENLLDHQYYVSSIPFNAHSIMPGTPRSFIGSVKIEF